MPWQSLTAPSMASAERMEVSDIFKLLKNKNIMFYMYMLLLFINLLLNLS